MTTNRSSAGGPARRAPEPRSWARPPGLALLALALVGLVQAGCQSDGCSTCGLAGSGRRSPTASSPWDQRRHQSGLPPQEGGGCSTCGEGGGRGRHDRRARHPGRPRGRWSSPAPGDDRPGPVARVGPDAARAHRGHRQRVQARQPDRQDRRRPTRRPPGASRPTTGRPTRRPCPGTGPSRGRTTDVAQALHSTPAAGPAESAPTTCSTTSRRWTSRRGDPEGGQPPGLGLGPVAGGRPGPGPAPAAAAPGRPRHRRRQGRRPDPRRDSLGGGGGGDGRHRPRWPPGIRRSASVAPSVGGGSAPSVEGLDWLKEKGYRTFLDLRSMSEIDPNFVDAVNDHGMVYISLPIVADRLDPSRLARFDDLIAQSENRPLYFCDSDGTRAGPGLVHPPPDRRGQRPAVGLPEGRGDRPDRGPGQAGRGLSWPPTSPGPRSAPRPAGPASRLPWPWPTSPGVDAPGPAPALPAASPAPTPPSAPVAAPAPADAPTAPMLPGEDRPQASTKPDPGRFREPIAWRPVAALVLTGIGVPLAYWSKSALSGVRSNRRRMASLPGSARRSLDAPAGSDA